MTFKSRDTVVDELNFDPALSGHSTSPISTIEDGQGFNLARFGIAQ